MRLGKLNIKRLERQDMDMIKHVLKFVIFAFIAFAIMLFSAGGI